MTVEEVQQAVIEVVADIQSLSGRQSGNITCATQPMRDLEGFDSLNAVEVATELSARVRCDLPQDVALFQQGNHAASISEIAREVHQFIQSAGGK